MATSRILRLPAFAGLLALAASAAAAAAINTGAGIRFDHEDWTLSCDNTRTCRAAGYQNEAWGDPGSLPVSVLLTRKAGPGQRVSGQLSVLPDESDDDFPKSAELFVDRDALGALAFDASSYAATLSAVQVAALLASLRRNTRIEVVETGPRTRRWTLSGKGATAVLLKMDEFQGRIGTPGALAGTGKASRPESAALPAEPAPVVTIPTILATTEADRRLASDAGLLEALRDAPLDENDTCDDLASKDGEPPELDIERLSDDRLLVSTRCWMAAYNAGTGYWVVNDRSPWRPQLVTTDATDYDGGRVSSGHKERGLGDCWSTAEWTWDGQRLIKTAEATSGLCRGFAGGAWQLPTLVTDVQD